MQISYIINYIKVVASPSNLHWFVRKVSRQLFLILILIFN